MALSRTGYAVGTVIALLFSACAAVNDSTVEVVTQTPETTAIAATVESTTEPPAIEATTQPADTVAPTPFPEHPHYLELEIANNPVLSSALADPTCQLPCWYGLRPGESPIKQVDTVFDEVFQFGGQIHLTDLLEEGLPLSSMEAPGLSYVSLLWQIDPNAEETGAFIIDAVFDQALMLRGIQMWQNPEGAYATESVQQMLQALGRPQHIGLDVSKVGYEQIGYLYIHILYTRGVSLLIIYAQEPLTEEPLTYEPLCLNQAPEMSYTSLVTAFNIAEPDQMNIIHRDWIGRFLSQDSDLRPVDEVLEMSEDQFIDLILQPQPCITIDYARFSEY
jgi:hypothetical protein